MAEEVEKLNGVKVLAFIGICFLFFDAITYFYAYTAGAELMLLYGILEFLFAIFIFLALKFWKFIADLIKISLPFNWWILLIFGVVTIIFGLLPNGNQGSYFTGTILTMAALIDLFGEKKGWKASKMMVLLGTAFGIFDCIVLFLGLANIPAATLEALLVAAGWSTTQLILNAIFGLIVAVILIILIFDFVDIKIPLEWWLVLAIGFAFWMWIGPMAFFMQGILTGAGTTILLTNFSGLILLIGFVLMVFGF
jgi:hypothetical protein